MLLKAGKSPEVGSVVHRVLSMLTAELLVLGSTKDMKFVLLVACDQGYQQNISNRQLY